MVDLRQVLFLHWHSLTVAVEVCVEPTLVHIHYRSPHWNQSAPKKVSKQVTNKRGESVCVCEWGELWHW